MLKNYLLVALRNLRKQKGYTFINVLGLTIGVACCLAIALFIRQELSFDRHHEAADRIYRLTTRAGLSQAGTHFAAAAPPMARIMKEEFLEVVEAVRILPATAVVLVGDRTFRESRFFFADSSIFNVFTLPFIHGDPSAALHAPEAVVLTRSTAEKYFGRTDVVGRSLPTADQGDFVVTGIIEDLPTASHFQFDLLASTQALRLQDDGAPESWVSNIGNYTYLLLRDEQAAAVVAARLPEFIDRNVGELLKQFGATFSLELQPLTQIHLHSDLTYEIGPTSDVAYIYIFGSAAIFILLIAGINFVNLSTARSTDRAREVGMRKVLGAQRAQLVRQFMVETLILAGIACVTALVVVHMTIPYLERLTGYTLPIEGAGGATLLGALACLAVVIGLLAGWYPSVVLSSYRPIEVLKGHFHASASGVTLRRALVVTQFAVSIILVVGTGIVSRQLAFAQSQSRGFESEQVLIAPLPENANILGSLKAQLSARDGIAAVSASDHFPGGPINDAVHIPEGVGDDRGIHFWRYNVDFNFLETLNMPLAAGRSFSHDHPTDSSAVLINETAARTLGWKDPIGKIIYEMPSPDPSVRFARHVIGVVEDFHFESVRNEIKPMVIAIEPRPEYLLVRVQPDAIAGTISFLQDRWEAVGAPFEYFFLDARFDALYESEERLSRIFGLFAMLAVAVACLGLFALSTYSVQQRTKEIGIRKVLGASVPSIVLNLTKVFAGLVLVGFIVAVPIAYVAAEIWLREFAYRIQPGAGLFLIAGGGAALIALLTISIQAVRAALANPSDTLRYE